MMYVLLSIIDSCIVFDFWFMHLYWYTASAICDLHSLVDSCILLTFWVMHSCAPECGWILLFTCWFMHSGAPECLNSFVHSLIPGSTSVCVNPFVHLLIHAFWCSRVSESVCSLVNSGILMLQSLNPAWFVIHGTVRYAEHDVIFYLWDQQSTVWEAMSVCTWKFNCTCNSKPQKKSGFFVLPSQPLMSIKKQFCRESGKERDWRSLWNLLKSELVY
jgi:hypothetical protein